MIVNGIIALVVTVVGPLVNSFLPHLSITSTLVTISTGAHQVGAVLGVTKTVIPLTVLFAWLGALLVLLPALGAFMVGQWVYEHLPTVAGTGTNG